MGTRKPIRVKSQAILLLLLIIFLLLFLYKFTTSIYNDYDERARSEKDCLSQLATANNRIEDINDSKVKLETLFQIHKKETVLLKKNMEEVSENCYTIKENQQQCQDDVDDLNQQLKAQKEAYEKILDEMEMYKKMVVHLKSEYVEAFRNVDTNKGENGKRLGGIMRNDNIEFKQFQKQKVPVLTRGETQREVEPDVYKIDISKGKMFDYAIKNKVNGKLLATHDRNMKEQFDSNQKLPPGFAPVLDVVEENGNRELDKPNKGKVNEQLNVNIEGPKLEFNKANNVMVKPQLQKERHQDDIIRKSRNDDAMPVREAEPQRGMAHGAVGQRDDNEYEEGEEDQYT